MKYAAEVIDLLACYPGRKFRMAEIMNHVSRAMPQSERAAEAMRKGVRRVLEQLMDSGQVARDGAGTKGACYSWCISAGQMSQITPNLGRDAGQYVRALAS